MLIVNVIGSKYTPELLLFDELMQKLVLDLQGMNFEHIIKTHVPSIDILCNNNPGFEDTLCFELVQKNTQINVSTTSTSVVFPALKIERPKPE